MIFLNVGHVTADSSTGLKLFNFYTLQGWLIAFIILLVGTARRGRWAAGWRRLIPTLARLCHPARALAPASLPRLTAPPRLPLLLHRRW